jgi:hypothetical protein
VKDVLVFVIKILTLAEDIERDTVGTEKPYVATLLVPIDISEAEFEVALSIIDTVTVR